jgi:hypothetical protein
VAPVLKTGKLLPRILQPESCRVRSARPVVIVLGKICTNYGLTVSTEFCTGYRPSIRSAALGDDCDPILPMQRDHGRPGHDLTVQIPPTEGDFLPCAEVVPSSQLGSIVYSRLGEPRLTPEALRSGIFYSRD